MTALHNDVSSDNENIENNPAIDENEAGTTATTEPATPELTPEEYAHFFRVGLGWSIGLALLFIGALIHRLSQFTTNEDGSFPFSHWLNTPMTITAMLAVAALCITAIQGWKGNVFKGKTKDYNGIVGFVLFGIVAGSVGLTTFTMNTVWENNFRGWAQDRYGITYDHIKTLHVTGSGGGCTYEYSFIHKKQMPVCEYDPGAHSVHSLIGEDGTYLAEVSGGDNVFLMSASAKPSEKGELPVRK